jgi:hypothetical protein
MASFSHEVAKALATLFFLLFTMVFLQNKPLSSLSMQASGRSAMLASGAMVASEALLTSTASTGISKQAELQPECNNSHYVARKQPTQTANLNLPLHPINKQANLPFWSKPLKLPI